MRVLVTGSEGVIGRELLLLLKDHEVMGLDRVGAPDFLCDLSSGSLNYILDFDPEIIFHLAASFERTNETPEFFEVNFKDNILASCRLNQLIPKLKNLKKYVFASSYLVYDQTLYMSQNNSPMTSIIEHDRLKPRNLCGMAKLYIEKELGFLTRFLESEKLQFVSARIFRSYGRGCRSFISRCVRAALNGEKIKAWNLNNHFDFIHARDVAEALLRLGFSSARGVINVGTGAPRSIEEVLRLTGVGYNHELKVEPIEYSKAYITTLKLATKWQPSITLEDGIKEIIEYEKSRLNNVCR